MAPICEPEKKHGVDLGYGVRYIVKGPSCQLALNINFEDVTSLIRDIIFLYQLAQAHPHNVLHFLVTFAMYSILYLGIHVMVLQF